MRRRARGTRDLSAAQIVEVFVRASNDNRETSHEVWAHAIRDGLSAYGYTPVDAIRARYWTRHGQPATYRWDES